MGEYFHSIDTNREEDYYLEASDDRAPLCKKAVTHILLQSVYDHEGKNGKSKALTIRYLLDGDYSTTKYGPPAKFVDIVLSTETQYKVAVVLLSSVFGRSLTDHQLAQLVLDIQEVDE